ncbi:MAG: OmpH family outer membrane protein [Alistipes sp.]|nr:OmpH family outer membrane protein [Alistipes sp.]
MKKIFFSALFAAVALTACAPKSQPAATAEGAADEVKSYDIAYIQVEAVLAESDLYKKEGAALQEKTQKAQNSWAQREKNLQAEAAKLQEKYQKGLITTNDAQAQQESIQRRAASYQSSAQKEAQALDEENFVFTNRAQDLLQRAVDQINSDGRYKLIINASALIDADTTLNITPAVLAKVNELYAADQAEKADKK